MGNYISHFLVNEVTITERFSPLIGIDLKTRKKMSIKLEYKTERTMNLSMSNNQITEINNKDIVIGFGYTKKGLHLKNIINLENNLTYKVDLSLRDTKTVQRLIEGTDKVTAGNINFRLNGNVNYRVDKKLNAQLFFERSFNEPRISSSFRRSNTAFGIRLRFSLS